MYNSKVMPIGKRLGGRLAMDYMVILILIIGIIILWKLTKKLLSLGLIVVLIYFIYINLDSIKMFLPKEW